MFNQRSKYVCSSFHARSRSSSWGFIFYCSSTYCSLDVRKNNLFLSTAIKPNRDKRNISTGQVLLNCPKEMLVEGSWARWQRAHSTLLPPELGWARGSRAESTPGTEHFPETKSWSCESKDFFPKDALGRRGAQPMGWCWG